jgi:hypothetical protein
MSSLTPLEAISLLIEEEIEKVEFRPYVLLSNLNKEDEYQSQIQWDVTVGGGTASGRATTADASLNNTDETKKAVLAIGDRVLGHGFSVLRTKIVEAKRTAPRALRSLFATHIERAFEIILPALNQALYTGTGNAASHGIFGLENVIANTAYAGIPTATYGEWASVVNGNAANRALSKALMDNLDNAIKRRGGNYTHIYTTPEIVKKYEDVFNSERSLTVNQINGIADIGFSGHAYRRTPIIEDVHCPDNTLYFLDLSKLKVKTYSLGDSRVMTNNEGKIVGAMADPTKTMDLNFLVAELPSNNPHALKMEISLQPQLQVRQPKCVAALKNIIQ